MDDGSWFLFPFVQICLRLWQKFSLLLICLQIFSCNGRIGGKRKQKGDVDDLSQPHTGHSPTGDWLWFFLHPFKHSPRSFINMCFKTIPLNSCGLILRRLYIGQLIMSSFLLENPLLTKTEKGKMQPFTLSTKVRESFISGCVIWPQSKCTKVTHDLHWNHLF